MKKVAIAMILSFGLIGSASAMPALGGVIHFVATHGTAAYIAVADSKVRDCDKAPVVLARHKGEPGYNFQVTQCELKSNDNIEPVK